MQYSVERNPTTSAVGHAVGLAGRLFGRFPRRLRGGLGRAPGVVSAVLVLLIALEIARAGEILLHHSATYPALTTPAASKGAAAPRLDTGSIVAAHLFGTPAERAGTEDPENAPSSSADLIMVGTIATSNPARGHAIIGAGGEFHVYSVGQKVGEASLKLVYSDHVVLVRNGSLEKLLLPHSETGAPVGRPPRAARPAAVAARQDHFAPLIETIAESDTETDSSGKFLGIRVVPGRDTSTFHHSGLKGGDVILAINGSPLDQSAKSFEMFTQLATGATVTVLRWGKQQDVTVNLAP